ncbi:glycosyltransferase [Patescibacteria group bacterium]|nr:glycosyltransferase [Patescibacteria group bacterium]MBU4512523.1 glycosyltransferase [Patescibacteria group bacterium]MCG2693498.1 glycosyltransferase [Candidatus Parcubacteria bacterium]
MNILIICQKLAEDDDLLGAFVPWVRAIAKRVDSVKVLCLAKGEYHLPENCEVYSLGKEPGVSRFGRWLNFIRLMFKLMPKCDVAFSHMSPIFSIASWPFVKLYRKKATLWYAHGHAGWKIKLAEKCVDVIFTSTKEGCRVGSDKIKVVGQGIDMNRFRPVEDGNKKQDLRQAQILLKTRNKDTKKFQTSNFKFQMVSIGRIAPSKDYETMIKAAEVLVKQGVSDFEIKVFGRANLAEHEKYFDKIKKMVKSKGLDEQIKFIGAVPNKDVVKYYQEADLYLNMSHTGSLDRAIVEAMACGTMVLTCNEAASGVLENIGLGEQLMYPKEDYVGLANKVLEIKKLYDTRMATNGRQIATNYKSDDQNIEKIRDMGQKLRQEVVGNHSVEALGGKIVKEFDNLVKIR